MTYRIPLDELIATSRVDDEDLVEEQDEPSTNGVPQDFFEDTIRIAAIAGG